MTAPSQKQDSAGCKKRKICQNRNALGPAADKKKKEKEKHGKSEKSMQDIRNMYGSEVYATRTEEPEKITA